MNLKNKITHKFISGLMIIALIAPTVFFTYKVKKTEAQFAAVVTDIVDSVPTVTKFVQDTLKTILESFLKTVARKLIDKMTQATIDWINSGFQGAPLFVQDPKGFFSNIIDQQLIGLINEIAYDPVKYPFGLNYSQNLINQAKNQFAQNAQYSLSAIYANDPAEIQRQQGDFGAGGWGGLLLNTQLMQNNFLGFNIMANEQSRQVTVAPGSKLETKVSQLAQGSGFLPQEVCPNNSNWDAAKLAAGPTPNKGPNGQVFPPTDAEVQAWNKLYGCDTTPQVGTPGRLAADSIMTAMGSKQRQGELGAALGNSLAAIFDTLTNKLFNMGLSAIGTGISGGKNATPPNPADTSLADFNIYGNTAATTPDTVPLGAENNPSLTPTNPHMTLTISSSDGTLYDPDSLKPFVNGIGSRFNSAETFTPGNYVVSIDPVPGYDIAYGQDCTNRADGGHITMLVNGTYSCHIYLNAKFFDTKEPEYVQVHLNVINDNYGTLTPDDVEFFLKAGPQDSRFGVQDTPYKYAAYGDDVVISTKRPDGYNVTYTGECNAQGVVNLVHDSSWFGHIFKCTMNLNDIPGWFQAKMAVNTVVVNDATKGGTLKPSDIQIMVDGKTQNTIPPVTTIVSGDTNEYIAGNPLVNKPPLPVQHTISGTPKAGYTVTFTGDCDADGNISLGHSANDSTSTCTMTYTQN